MKLIEKDIDKPNLDNEHDIQLKDATIMIVDDEPINMEVVKAFLEESGYHKFFLVEDSTQAMTTLDETKPDILLLDLVMPEVTGFDILKEVRDHAKHKYIPIIILTSATDTESKLRALDLGATDFLAKPVDQSELSLRVRNTLAAKAYQDQLAYYDPLTNLPNKEFFLQRIEWSIATGNRYNEVFSIFSIGVDNLGKINATIGPEAGDLILKELAERIKQLIRSVDVVTHEDYGDAEISFYRTEGSGFSLILNRISNAKNASLVAKRLLKEMAKPFIINDTDTFLSTSIGVAMYPDDGSNESSLLHAAASARDFVKNRNNNKIQFASDEINRTYKQRMNLEGQLQKAIERKELLLHYQPKVDIKSNTLCGAEALLRLQPTKGKLIPPVTFIPVAEETGLIIPIGEWIIHEACTKLKEWNKKNSTPFRLNINISVKQLSSPDFLKIIMRIIKQNSIVPSLLTLEITESLLIDQIETKIDILKKLKDLGLRISIDDFGTGYSSFSYLRKLPIDELKIDGSFITDLHENDSSHAIISSIIYLSKSLGLSTVAECVETEDQLTLLKKEQCDQYQGYLYSRPVPEADMLKLLCLKK